MNSKCDFIFHHYFDVLDHASKSYHIAPVREYPNLKLEKRFILLRHDVDLSLRHALQLSELEHKQGLYATYFVLLHSPWYNALSKEGVDAIKSIAKLGHEIGLHYDTSFLDIDAKTAIRQLQEEASILSYIIGAPVTSIVQHNPTITPTLKAEINSVFLDARDIPDVTYISDSVRNWRKGCMCNHIDKVDRLEINTHPILWHEKSYSRNETLDKFRNDMLHHLDMQIEAIKHQYEKYIDDLKKENMAW